MAFACSSTGNNATGPGGGGGGNHTTGSLTVTVTSPAGVTPSVAVSGPSGFLRTLTATQTLSGLAPGGYTIVATTSATADPIVGVPYSGSVTGSPATVVANETATASVAYAKRGNEGLLWVGNYSAPMAAFTSTQLAATGSPTPMTINADGPTSMVLDAAGGVWMTTSFTSDSIVYYTQAQLLGGGTPTAAVRILPATYLGGTTALALDAKGDLWAIGQYANTLVEFTPDQLTKSGKPTPAVTITAAFGSIDRPFAMAFDAKGNLWVASINDSTIAAFSPSELAAGGEQVPVAGLNRETATSAVVSIAFDSAGNLWAAGYKGVAEFAAKDLASIGSPAPAVMLTLTNAGLPNGLAFDATGDLWVADQQNNRLLEYTPAQLATSGTPTPTAVINAAAGSLNYPAAMVFSPHALDLPLH